MSSLFLSSASQAQWGKRVGVIAGLLGVVAVLAEFCFLFPDLLVVKEALPFYRQHLVWLRLILQIVIVLTFVGGLLSAIWLRSKWHGGVAMMLAMVATLLGGSEAEPLSNHARPFTAGLDYFLLELLILALVFIPMERLWTLREQKIFRLGWQTDLKHFFLSHVGVQLISFATLIPVQIAFAWLVEFDFQHYVRAQPLWLQFIEILFFVDLISYWVHRAFHQIPALWKFHAIHHSSLHMDWLAGSRSHIVDVLVNRCLGFIPIFVLGFSAPAVYAYITFVSFHAVYIHANVNHRWPFLRQVIATPEFHHWHHTSDEEGIDKNFAVFLAFIDRLFGTFHLPNYWPQRYGTTQFQPPETWWGQLLYPFKRHDNTPYG